MAATEIYSVTMVLWKETAFPLCRAMERRWKRNDVSLLSSVIVVIRLPISCLYKLNGHLMQCTRCLYGKWVEDVCVCWPLWSISLSCFVLSYGLLHLA